MLSVAAFIITISSSETGGRTGSALCLCQPNKVAWQRIDSKIPQRKKCVEFVAASSGSTGELASGEGVDVFNTSFREKMTKKGDYAAEPALELSGDCVTRAFAGVADSFVAEESVVIVLTSASTATASGCWV